MRRIEIENWRREREDEVGPSHVPSYQFGKLTSQSHLTFRSFGQGRVTENSKGGPAPTVGADNFRESRRVNKTEPERGV